MVEDTLESGPAMNAFSYQKDTCACIPSIGRDRSYFDKFLKDQRILLKAKEHDNLLVDDEVYSRSREYLWTLVAYLSLTSILAMESINGKLLEIFGKKTYSHLTPQIGRKQSL
jgi:hypothetical protein